MGLSRLRHSRTPKVGDTCPVRRLNANLLADGLSDHSLRGLTTRRALPVFRLR